MSAPIDQRKREYDERRYAENPWRKWYSNAPWAKAKRRQLARQPLCEMCEGRGRTVPASIVHHRTPHRGDWALFIDADNHASLCKPCHDSTAQSAERLGYSDEVGRRWLAQRSTPSREPVTRVRTGEANAFRPARVPAEGVPPGRWPAGTQFRCRSTPQVLTCASHRQRLRAVDTRGRGSRNWPSLTRLPARAASPRINYGQFSTNGRIVSWAGEEMAATSC